MKINPYINAFVASAYIVVVVFVMNSLQAFVPNTKQTIFVPMFVLSLFVLSAAIMGFLFFYQPFRLYFDGHKNEALVFFLKTLGAFALFVVAFFFVLIYRVYN